MDRTKSQYWEQGSDFHWLTDTEEIPKVQPWSDACVYGGTGRDVLCLLLKHGMQTRHWRRLWLPAYFCNEVTCAILETGIDVAVYPWGPFDKGDVMGKISFRPDDVLLVVNYFGISKCLKYRKDQRQQITIIEDHTHDPWSDWSYSSKADWCIASLRKLLPLPDGGVLWSPLNHPMPSAVSITRERKYASLQKIAGMSLKSLYIQGGAVKKDTFRPLLIDAEKEIAKGALSGMTDWSKDLLSSYPVDRWREKRRINHRCLSYNLSDLPWLTVPVIADEKGRCPYSGIIVFDNAGLCSYVRDKLIKTDIYPAVLWPLEKSIVKGIPDQYVELSRRLLSICCDMRYDEEDMLYVGRKIREYGNEYINVRL